MIERHMFRARLKKGMEERAVAVMYQEHAGQTFIDTGHCMTVAGFIFERDAFLYIEQLTGQVAPELIVPGLNAMLEDWPGQEEARKWIALIDVFHFNEPASLDHWNRKEKPERIGGRVAYLRPEMVASYIFYHYQLQEERGFTGPKYEMIGMHENLLFGYQEFPAVVEEPILPGRLTSKHTPVPWATTRMDLHFKEWEDGHQFFKRFDAVFHCYVAREKGSQITFING